MLTKQEEERKEKLLKLYEEQSKANCIEMYFIYNKTLYKKQMKSIDNNITTFGRTSKSKGNKEVIRMRILTATKQQWIKEGNITKVMQERKFLQLSEKLGLNKGQTCEYISCKARKIEYKLDNVRYDKAGDLDLKKKRIQVKFQNASIATVDTILKLANANV